MRPFRSALDYGRLEGECESIVAGLQEPLDDETPGPPQDDCLDDRWCMHVSYLLRYRILVEPEMRLFDSNTLGRNNGRAAGPGGAEYDRWCIVEAM